jgi:hypothetical protein
VIVARRRGRDIAGGRAGHRGPDAEVVHQQSAQVRRVREDDEPAAVREEERPVDDGRETGRELPPPGDEGSEDAGQQDEDEASALAQLFVAFERVVRGGDPLRVLFARLARARREDRTEVPRTKRISAEVANWSRRAGSNKPRTRNSRTVARSAMGKCTTSGWAPSKGGSGGMRGV